MTETVDTNSEQLTLPPETIQQLADHIDGAALDRQAIAKITNDHPGMSWVDAYAIQEAVRENFNKRGEDSELLFKAGLTSHAKMEQMGVKEPVFGFLAPSGKYASGDTASCSKYIHPRVEAEIALRLDKDLHGPDCTTEMALDTIGEVMPAIEIIDSRYKDFKFDMKSVVADNTSAAGWVIGKAVPFNRKMDLPDLDLALAINSEAVANVKGSAVLGHPALSVAMLVNHLSRQGRFLPKGALILTGGASAAFAVKPGDIVSLGIPTIGSINVGFD